MLIRKRVPKKREFFCKPCFYEDDGACNAPPDSISCTVIDKRGNFRLFIFIRKEEKK